METEILQRITLFNCKTYCQPKLLCFSQGKTQNQCTSKTQKKPSPGLRQLQNLVTLKKKKTTFKRSSREDLYLQIENKTNCSHGTLSDPIQVRSYRLLMIKKKKYCLKSLKQGKLHRSENKWMEIIK